jgi:hypothetical protein
MQLVFAAVVFGFAWEAWPSGLLSVPFASWDLASVLYGLLALVLFALGLVMLYFVLTEQSSRLSEGESTRQRLDASAPYEAPPNC